MVKYTQHSFSGGQIDRDLMGRQDLAKYFIGATTLRNFAVKRQGCLEKRRGTELVADLTGLLGDGIAIAASNTAAFAFERDQGYVILMAAPESGTAKAFVCSDQGILVVRRLEAIGNPENVSESCIFSSVARPQGGIERVISVDPNSGEQIYTDYRAQYTPYAMDLPYRAEDLDAVSTSQSGDTLFLAHRSYPFARIVRMADGSFAYAPIDFSSAASALSPPTVSCTVKGDTDSGTEKTVSYVATYVKDGVESAPSVPFRVSYHLPWPNTMQVLVSLAKGDNATEPDYYNIYKKSGGEYGFIGNTSAASQSRSVSAVPTDFGGLFPLYASLSPAQAGIAALKTENPYGAAKITDNAGLFGGLERGLVTGGSWTGEDASPASPTAIALPSGHLVTGARVRLDCFVLSRYESDALGGMAWWDWACFRTLGRSLRLTLTLTDGKTTKTFSQTQALQQPDSDDSGTRRIYCAKDDTTVPGKPKLWPRDVDFALGDQIEAAFPSGGAWCTRLELSASDSEDGAPVNGAYSRLVLSQICLYCDSIQSNTFSDDYITPDVSLTPPVSEPHFNSGNDYPGCAAICQQRLCLAATQAQPFTFWMSATGDLYGFDTHATLREDDPIEATLPATEFPEINHLVMTKDLLIFCDSGEWVVSPTSGNAISYKTVQCKLQSQIGCSKTLRPLVVADEVVFAEATGKTLRASRYDFASDGYRSTDLSVLSQDIFEDNPIVDMDYRQHPDSQLVCVLQDGTLALLSYMREHELAAWSTARLGGGLKALDVCTPRALSSGSTDLYLLAERTDAEGRIRHSLLRMRDGVPPATVADALCMDAIRWVTPDIDSYPEDGARAVDLITGQSAERMTAGRSYAVGYPYEALFRSVRPEAQGQQTVQFELKNAITAELRLLDASPVELVPTSLESDSQNQWTHTGPEVTPDETGALALSAFDAVINLGGHAEESGAITLRSATHWPLRLLSFSVNYEFDPRLTDD